MKWTWHKAVIAVAAVVVMAGLVTGALLALRGGGTAKMTSAEPSPGYHQLRSPFTGEPVPPLTRVLAVTRAASVSYPAASFRFTWSAAKQRWLVSMDGVPALTPGGGRLSPATVVIQRTTVRTSRFREYGYRPPYAESTGSGTALVLRDGRAWTTHWSRPHGNSGTVLTTASGQRMTFAQGQVWIVLTRR